MFSQISTMNSIFNTETVLQFYYVWFSQKMSEKEVNRIFLKRSLCLREWNYFLLCKCLLGCSWDMVFYTILAKS